jgi:hypothetical protein
MAMASSVSSVAASSTAASDIVRSSARWTEVQLVVPYYRYI